MNGREATCARCGRDLVWTYADGWRHVEATTDAAATYSPHRPVVTRRRDTTNTTTESTR